MNRVASLLVSASAVACLSAGAPASLLLHENFGHTPGDNLVGKTPAGESSPWAQDATGTALTLASGDLAAPAGLQASSGNRVQLPSAGTQQSAQVPFDATGANDLYYSYLLRLDTISGLSTSTWSTLSRVELSTTNGAGVFVRLNGSDTNKFDLGIHKRANGGAVVTDPTLTGLNKGEVLLVVARYNTNGANPDSMDIWINPASASFGAGAPPAPTFSSTAGGDITAAWNTFVIDPPNASVQGYFDELRVGTTWADVTPVPEPTAAMAATALGGVLLWRRR